MKMFYHTYRHTTTSNLGVIERAAVELLLMSALAVMEANDPGFDARRQKDMNQRINGLILAINIRGS